MVRTHLTLVGMSNFTDNSAREGAGVYAATKSTIDFDGINTNKVIESGGGIYMSMTHLTVAGMNTFTNNSARKGGGIHASANSNLYVDGLSTFHTNRAGISGGGVWMDNSHLIMNGSSDFVRCTAGIEGGGVSMYNVTANLPGNNKFISNSAISGGGIIVRWSNFSFTNSSHFSNNSAADTGRGISTSISIVVLSGNNTFDMNCADLGGGVYMLLSSFKFLGINHFNLNHARRDGGGIYARDNGTIDLSGSNSFKDDKAERGGGMFVEFCWLFLSGSSLFHSNKGMTGGVLYLFNSVFELFRMHSHFTTNSAINAGGGLTAIYSTLNLAGNATFERNSALTGGARRYSVADSGGVRRVMYFCVHNCTSPSNDYAGVACSNNNQA